MGSRFRSGLGLGFGSGFGLGLGCRLGLRLGLGVGLGLGLGLRLGARGWAHHTRALAHRRASCVTAPPLLLAPRCIWPGRVGVRG